MTRLYAVIATLLFFGVVAGVAGYKGYRLGVKLTDAKWNAAQLEATTDAAETNIKIVNDRKKVNHENQNRDRDALILNGCKRGWVRDHENCPTTDRKTRSLRDGVLRDNGHNRNYAPSRNE